MQGILPSAAGTVTSAGPSYSWYSRRLAVDAASLRLRTLGDPIWAYDDHRLVADQALYHSACVGTYPKARLFSGLLRLQRLDQFSGGFVPHAVLIPAGHFIKKLPI